MNSSSSSVGAAVLLNVSSAPAAYDSFSNAVTKNTVAMLVWLLLSVSNGSMVLTFLSHRYAAPPAARHAEPPEVDL